jgi:predicted  nucleic acid-binding Zn-ribbon protein
MLMNDTEFADYQSRYNHDPVVQRLCKIIFDNHRIEDLEDEIGVLTDELSYFERQLKEARYEIKQLEARTIEDMAADLVNRVTAAESRSQRYREEKDNILAKNKELQEKINVWSILER